jgi:arylsulfatase A-like enzyme
MLGRTRSARHLPAARARPRGYTPDMAISRACACLAGAGLWLAAAATGCGDGALPELAPPRFPDRIERPRPAAPAGRPNLLLVSLDTLRADRLGAYGHDRPTSPAFDRLARRSTLFESAFSHSPKTAPSHMTIFTGLYPEAHRVKNRFNGRNPWLGRVSPAIPLLAEMLRAAGYRTVGRTAGANVDGSLGFERGFDSYERAGRGAHVIFRAAGAALERLAAEGADGRPFFLFVHTYQIHSPYLPPPRYRDAFVSPDYSGAIETDPGALGSTRELDAVWAAFWERVDRESPADRAHLLDLYDACIRFTDDQLAGLLERLDALGVADETIVVVLSDHGEEFGGHGDFEHDALWQEILHVPLLVHVPEALREGWQGRRVDAPVGLVDVTPTLLELVGLPVPAHVQGRSLVGVVERGEPARPWVFSQYRLSGDVALRAGRWKWLRDETGDRLYDLGDDPGETRAAGEAGPAVREALMEQGDRVLRASRAYRALAPDSTSGARIDPAMREQLRALGYLDDREDEGSP